MRRGSLLDSYSRPQGKERSSLRSVTKGGAVVALGLVLLLLLLYPVDKVRRENRRLLAELSEVQLDLEAHQEALKISRERCDSKIKIFTENEAKYQQSIEYYKETDKRLSEEWCQKMTDAAMSEYKKVCQRNVDSYVKKLENLNAERDDLVKRMEPISLCCKSATAKNKALMSGLDKEAAKRKGAEAVAASIRAMRDPDTVRAHKQHIEWHPGGVQDRVGETRRVSRDRVRLPGLGDDTQSKVKEPSNSKKITKPEHDTSEMDNGEMHAHNGAEEFGDGLSDIIARAAEEIEAEDGDEGRLGEGDPGDGGNEDGSGVEGDWRDEGGLGDGRRRDAGDVGSAGLGDGHGEQDEGRIKGVEEARGMGTDIEKDAEAASDGGHGVGR